MKQSHFVLSLSFPAIIAHAEAPDISLTSRLDVGSFSGDRDLNNSSYQSYLAGFFDLTAEQGPVSLKSRVVAPVKPDRQRRDASARLRELLVHYQHAGTRVSVGRQIMPLGRSDGINPSDVLTPWHRTELVLDDTDQRAGRLAARIDQEIDSLLVSAIFFYDNSYNELPITDSGIRIDVDKKRRPAGALIIDRTGEQVDWSVSYYDGADLQPSYDVSSVAAGVIKETHKRSKVFSADVAFNIVGFGMRGEISCSELEKSKSPTEIVRSNQCAMVYGVDHDIRGDDNISLQAYYIRADDINASNIHPSLVRDYAALIGQSKQNQGGVIIRYNIITLNDSLNLEFPLAFSIDTKGHAFSPRLTYQLSDHVRLRIGVDHYSGDSEGILGRLKHNSLVFLGLQNYIN